MRLFVCLEGEIAGTVQTDGSRASFAYAPEWLRAPGAYPLSHSLPLAATEHSGRQVLNFLWGLLPDNDRVLDTWARWFQVSARNPLALLAHVGEDCAGAVQFVTEERLPDVLRSASSAAEVEWLTDADLDSRMRQLVRDGAAGRTAEEGQFSLAGAQTKMALYFDDAKGRWGIPRGRTPTTHILKPVANDFDGFAENEHFCLALARRIGLGAARSEWRHFADVPTLIVERYDRMQTGGIWRRIHQEDCCQALGVHPASKYESEGGPGLSDIMSLLDSTDAPETDRDRFMKAVCLNYLLAASDAHAKNFSVLYARGASRPSMRLAPFYDIASAWPYPKRLPVQKLKLAMRIGGHYRLREILPRHFHKLALTCNYSPSSLMATLQEMCAGLADEAAAVAADTGAKGEARAVLGRLVDGLAAQCRVVQSHFQAIAAQG